MADVLVTGFGPFGTHDVNASSVVVNRLKDETWSNLTIHFEEFPVEFEFVGKRVRDLNLLIKPNVYHVSLINLHSSKYSIVVVALLKRSPAAA